MAELCGHYWYPLYAFARRRGHSPEDAEDLTQGFFLHLVEHQALARVDRLKGKFRSFLLWSFQNYLSIQAHRARNEAIRDSLLAGRQCPYVLYGASVAALAAYTGILAAMNAAVSVWAMLAVFVAALTSSIAGFAFSAICGAMLFHLLGDPVQVVEIMMICSIAGQALMVWSQCCRSS